MNINQKIIAALSPLGYPVEYAKYEPTPTEPVSDKYIVFNYVDEVGDNFADDAPMHEVAFIQIHLFAPKNFNHMPLKKNIKKNLFDAGFTYPSVQTLYEDDTKVFHLVFETQIEGGIN